MNKEELWQAALARLQFNVSRANFAAWFKEAVILDWQDDLVSIGTPNSFSKEWLEKKHHQDILKALNEVCSEIKKIKYVVSKQQKTNIESRPPVAPETKQIQFEEFQLNPRTGLNNRYTFKDFIVASFNEMAFAAAEAVVQEPGRAYNPLFIYGGVGLGKTHLLQAIGNKLDEEDEIKIKYISADKLVSQIVSSIYERSIESLKKEFQRLDVLIVDDIQFVAGKEKTQEEFFHVFNALYEKNSQIILSSDRLPSAIPALEKRLRSRFEGGMVVDISRPDYESRRAILETKIKEWKADVDPEALDYIATNIQNNVRELEGALRRLIAHQNMKKKKLNLESARKVLRDLTRTQTKTASPQKIISSVAAFYDLDLKELTSETRKKDIAFPRQIAMYLLRKDLKKSYLSIGNLFGGRDHTTVIYACNKIEEEVSKDGRLTDEISMIRQRIYGE
jgi:chromosomal replication initiator protein